MEAHRIRNGVPGEQITLQSNVFNKIPSSQVSLLIRNLAGKRNNQKSNTEELYAELKKN